MNKDFKNVILTFGLIAAALMSGSFLYRKQVDREYLLAVTQEQLQKIKDQRQARTDQQNQQASVEPIVAEQIVLSPVPAPASPKTVAKPTVTTAGTKPLPAPAVVPSSPPPKPVVNTPPQPPPRVVVKPTRSSRAS